MYIAIFFKKILFLSSKDFRDSNSNPALSFKVCVFDPVNERQLFHKINIIDSGPPDIVRFFINTIDTCKRSV